MLVNIARYLSLDPESALRKTNRKFKRRFQWMEEQLRASGRSPREATAEELESLWQQVEAARTRQPVTADSIVLRKCQGLDELRACVALQKQVWNFSDVELVPLRIFVVAEKIGGQVIGGFDSRGNSGLRVCYSRVSSRAVLSPLAHAGRAPGVSERGPGAATSSCSSVMRQWHADSS